jgi:hypothetical protein
MEKFLRYCGWLLVRVLGAFIIAFGVGMAAGSTLWWSLLGAVIAMAGIRIVEVNWESYQNFQQYPYYWRCDRCLRNKHQLFFVRAVDEQTRDEFRDNHNRLVHLEER